MTRVQKLIVVRSPVGEICPVHKKSNSDRGGEVWELGPVKWEKYNGSVRASV